MICIYAHRKLTLSFRAVEVPQTVAHIYLEFRLTNKVSLGPTYKLQSENKQCPSAPALLRPGRVLGNE